jgi:hypothetical protein
MTTTPDETTTVDEGETEVDDSMSLEDFCQWMEESVLEQFATWWNNERAKQPDIFVAEMSPGEWLDQFDSWWEAKGAASDADADDDPHAATGV